MTVAMGMLLRALEALAHSAPTLLCGLLIAGIFRRVLGPENTLRLFGGTGWRSLPQAWLWGMLLPVCSLGVIPILRELKRAGLPGGAIVAFALSAPLFNPLSVLYGLTLSQPAVILVFALGSLVIVTMVGLVWGWLFAAAAGDRPDDTPVPYGWRRMVAMLLVGCREMAGPTLGYLAVALVGVGLLAGLLPYGYLQFTMMPDDLLAPPLMALVAFPAYVTPTTVMMQIGMMFDHGNSIGAAFVLLTVGAGVTFALVAWMVANYGLRPTLGWLGLLAAVVLLLAYTVGPVLQFARAEAMDHTHAFDIFCFPFPDGLELGPAEYADHARIRIQRFEWNSLAIIGGFFALGLLLRLIDPSERLEAWLVRPAAATSAPSLDIALPNWVLGLTGLAGLVALSIAGCYIYYPEPALVIDQISKHRAELWFYAKRMEEEDAEHHLEIWMDLTRKLEIGCLVRGIPLPADFAAETAKLRHLLDELRHAVEDEKSAEVETLLVAIQKQHEAVRDRIPQPFRAQEPE